MTTDDLRHRPVLLDRAVDLLVARPGGRYVDVTLGDGHYACAVARAAGDSGQVLALDRDPDALERSRDTLASVAGRVRAVHGRFGELTEHLRAAGWQDGVDGIVADLGVSTAQILGSARGFSFLGDAPLDMRMDPTSGETAAELIARLPEKELADTIYRYGDERASRAIARTIVARRRTDPIETTAALRDAVVEAGVRGRPGHDPATRTFQALRIAVNDELGELETLLDEGWQALRTGGRFVVVSYHSLEDRLVKNAFRRLAAACLCEPGMPVCNCGWSKKVRFVVRGREAAGDDEIARNPRARSAGLRAVERFGDASRDATGGRR